MKLNELIKIKANKGTKKRIGRGRGSGKGFHTVGKGQKGQNSRKGRHIPAGFEGGQTPLYKKLPKFKTFKKPKMKVITVSLTELNVFKEGSIISPSNFTAKPFKTKIKILNKGSIEKKLQIKNINSSESAEQKLLKAGCDFLD